tara:strand:- start:340 stop:513 length:174 start_codon:yes stop_codon:yes gene_type:complete
VKTTTRALKNKYLTFSVIISRIAGLAISRELFFSGFLMFLPAFPTYKAKYPVQEELK